VRHEVESVVLVVLVGLFDKLFCELLDLLPTVSEHYVDDPGGIVGILGERDGVGCGPVACALLQKALPQPPALAQVPGDQLREMVLVDHLLAAGPRFLLRGEHRLVELYQRPVFDHPRGSVRSDCGLVAVDEGELPCVKDIGGNPVEVPLGRRGVVGRMSS
jgi:hypothetical protein